MVDDTAPAPFPPEERTVVAPLFQLSVDRANEGEVVRVVGNLDRASAATLEEVLEVLSDQTVIVDFSGLDFIDSCGYAALIRARRTLEAAEHSVVIRGPLKPEVTHFFDVVKERSGEVTGWDPSWESPDSQRVDGRTIGQSSPKPAQSSPRT